MPNALRIIEAICKDLNRTGYVSSPRAVPQKGFDLTGFQPQKSDIPGLTTEYVKQSGPGILDDDYQATLAYLIGNKFFVVQCNT
ncbi:hypothetical protein ACOI1H_16255 [Loktanella sp. DJP18]|uniref:hypothetical protein n=1 Tax=Loktanella sp. DJP18 TaxID=3409788 RepID=UPI003BB6DD68